MRRPAPTCSRGGSTSPRARPRQRIADAILNSGIRAEKAIWDEYKYYPDQFFEPYLTPPPQGRLRPLRPARHRPPRRRPDARPARPQLRLLRRAGRHDLHHRPPAEPGLVDRLRHVPAEHHGGGAGQGPAHLPAGGVRALSPPDPAGARHPRRGDRGLRHGARLRGYVASPRTTCAPSARRWKSG